MEWSTIGLVAYLLLSITLLIIISISLLISKRLKSVIRYNDKVILHDQTEGIVKYIGHGEALGKKDTYLYGIDITKGDGDNNGEIENITYFKTKNNKNTGKFVKKSKITQITKTKQTATFTVGNVAFVEEKCIGVIRYVGIPMSCTTLHYGIELWEPIGECDGTYENIKYFSCNPNQGIYVEESKLNQTVDTVAINEANKYESIDFRTQISEVWSLRSIYSSVLVHLYDTSTDVAVCIQFGMLMLAEESGKKDYKSINMLSFFIASICFMLFYRIVAGLYYNHFFNTKIGKHIYSYFDLLLVVTDLYLIKLVHASYKAQYKSPAVFHKMLNLFESLFEAMPQLVLQFAFVIKSVNEPDLENVPLELIFISLLASICSITNKFMYDDSRCVNNKAETIHCAMSKFPCLSFSFLLRVVWRFTELIVRFSIFSLLFVVLGAFYLVIYGIISLIVYLLLSKLDIVRVVAKKVTNIFTIIFTLQALIGIPLKKEKKLAIIRIMDNALSLTVITLFAVVKFECFMCAKWDERSMELNIYVEYCIYIAWIALFIEFILYIILLSNDIILQQRKEVDKYTLHPGITNYFNAKKQKEIDRTDAHDSENKFERDKKIAITAFRGRATSVDRTEADVISIYMKENEEDYVMDEFRGRADSESSIEKDYNEFAFRAFTFCGIPTELQMANNEKDLDEFDTMKNNKTETEFVDRSDSMERDLEEFVDRADSVIDRNVEEWDQQIMVADTLVAQ